ncbi:Cytochrome b561/ferric reductase transmembrane [Phytophthora cinnamomi]|uniref:Cytochrome b561/ferric reductase transmembrane n=1 Tax=Phytophthora cinnamomi TaxID=4785 RepID=UPI00355997B2|nr:Cytochrome b561/ferric reductase transmembrane [Phytophthora cinnamomi]
MARRSELALTAALFLLPCAAVLERCVADGSLLALHAALNALAMLVCLPSALQAMLLRKHMTNHAKRVWLTKLHLLLNVAAGTLVAAAGAAAFIAKRDAGDQHLATPHSWAALVTAMFFALNVFQGLLLTFEGEKANWQWKDETHVLTGVLVYVGGVATMLYGLHTSSWGARNFSPERQFQLTVLVIAAHVTLLGKSLVLQRRESQVRLQKVAKVA